LNASLHICAFLPRFFSPPRFPRATWLCAQVHLWLIVFERLSAYLRVFAAFFPHLRAFPPPRAVFSSKRVKGFLENAGQRDLLAQFQSIEAEMASRMKSECFILIFSVFEFLDFPDLDPSLFVWVRSGSFHHQAKTIR
jgi:hypothetical protein